MNNMHQPCHFCALYPDLEAGESHDRSMLWFVVQPAGTAGDAEPAERLYFHDFCVGPWLVENPLMAVSLS
jgi:hypothetical protein